MDNREERVRAHYFSKIVGSPADKWNQNYAAYRTDYIKKQKAKSKRHASRTNTSTPTALPTTARKQAPAKKTPPSNSSTTQVHATTHTPTAAAGTSTGTPAAVSPGQTPANLNPGAELPPPPQNLAPPSSMLQATSEQQEQPQTAHTPAATPNSNATTHDDDGPNHSSTTTNHVDNDNKEDSEADDNSNDGGGKPSAIDPLTQAPPADQDRAQHSAEDTSTDDSSPPADEDSDSDDDSNLDPPEDDNEADEDAEELQQSELHTSTATDQQQSALQDNDTSTATDQQQPNLTAEVQQQSEQHQGNSTTDEQQQSNTTATEQQQSELHQEEEEQQETLVPPEPDETPADGAVIDPHSNSQSNYQDRLNKHYAIPDKDINFDHASPVDIPPDAQALLNHTTDFEEATETLAPKQELQAVLSKLRTDLQKFTKEMTTCANVIRKGAENPKFVHDTAKIKPGMLLLPADAKSDHELGDTYKGIYNEMEALRVDFQRKATAVAMHKCKLRHLQLKLKRINTLLNTLIEDFGSNYLSKLREFQLIEFKLDKKPLPKNPTEPETQAIVAVWRLIQGFDKEMLSHLEINKPALEKHFIKVYGHPPTDAKFTDIEKECIQTAIKSMLVFIKCITVHHHKQVERKRLQQNADNNTIGRMETKKASQKMAAVNNVIQNAAPTLPKDNVTFGKAVQHTMRKSNKAQAKSDKKKARKREAAKAKNAAAKRKATTSDTTDSPSKRAKFNDTTPKEQAAAKPPAATASQGGKQKNTKKKKKKPTTQNPTTPRGNNSRTETSTAPHPTRKTRRGGKRGRKKSQSDQH